MSKQAEQERLEAIASLRKYLKPNDTVFVSCESVSRSGMSRVLNFRIFRGSQRNPRPIWLSSWIAKACGYSMSRDPQGVKVSGCGMDMGFSVVYGLGRTLWPKGTRKAHGSRNGEPDRGGGYALNYTWI